MERTYPSDRALLRNLYRHQGERQCGYVYLGGPFMKNKKYLLLLLSSFLLGCSEKEIDEIPLDTRDPFSFAGNYENPELTIDGKDDEEEWKSEWASETYTIS